MNFICLNDFIIENLILSQNTQFSIEDKITFTNIIIAAYSKSRDISNTKLLELIIPFLNNTYTELKKNLENIKNTNFEKISILQLIYSIDIFFSKKENLENIIQHWKNLSTVLNYKLEKNSESMLNFFDIYIDVIYGIKKEIRDILIFLMKKKLEIKSCPLGIVSKRKFNLNSFIPKSLEFKICTIEKMSRLFSVPNFRGQKYLFIDNYLSLDIFDSCRVIHEVQHLQDKVTNSPQSLFSVESRAIKSEWEFLKKTDFTYRHVYCWLESNLFQPLSMLKFELDMLLSFEYNEDKYLQLNGIQNFANPFQFSVYAASVIDQVDCWEDFFINIRPFA